MLLACTLLYYIPAFRAGCAVLLAAFVGSHCNIVLTVTLHACFALSHFVLASVLRLPLLQCLASCLGLGVQGRAGSPCRLPRKECFASGQ